MAGDHARLDGLLARSLEGPDVARAAFGAFRGGLLRHIGLEETVLLPALSGWDAALAAKLRLEHGAITNLLVPEPTRAIAAALRAILAPHNRAEEKPGGLYDAVDALPAAEVERLAARLRGAPDLPLRPYSKRPQALEAAKRAMARAGFDWDACAGGGS
ncbi:MAG: hemerythrin domain-containing protein [Elusimicrobia bacterium]|nr:hemerythrin domain-containing protein [Elusimicrobiota bacterium]